MHLIAIFITKILLTSASCPPYDATGTVCNSPKYMVDSKVCAPICPSLFTPYQLNCPSCENYCSSPATATDAILFTLELSTVQDLTLTYVADSLDSSKKFENPGGISYNSLTQNSPLPTYDRGFYFATTSSMIGNQSYIPGIYFLMNLWIKPLASGDILNIQIGSTTYIRVWDDATNVYKFNTLIYTSSGAQDSVTGASSSHNTSWQRLSTLLNQSTCSLTYIIFYLNMVPVGTTTLNNHEAIFPSGTYTWTFGNISGGNSFRGFIYWLQVRADYNAVYGTITPTVECVDNQYISGTTCMNCDISCPTWPWCISGSTCLICLLTDCNSCSGYYPLGCSSCNTGVTPYCCDYLGTACTQTWTNTACSTGINNAGVCLYGYPYGWSNCGGNLCFSVLTVDFTTSFTGLYDSVYKTGTSSVSYNYWNSPETNDPFPAKNRGLYFNSNQFLTAKINLSNTWSMGMWVYVISGTIIKQSTSMLIISSSGVVNFGLEKWNGNSAIYTASKSIPLNVWSYISYSVGFASKSTTLTPYINTVPGTATTVLNRAFRLPDNGILYIGYQDFNGFISYFQLWGTTITDFSVPYNLYGFTGGVVSTLWPCDYSHYYDGSVCQSCLGSCTMGCTRGNSCYICDDFLCAQCSSFLAGDCTSCITNASGTPCACSSGFYQPTNQALCSPCYTGCDICTGSGYHQCTSCKSGFYFLSVQCLAQCPWGYLPDSTAHTCTLSSITYGLSFYNNILLNTISGVNVGSSNTNTYPTYDTNDPYPVYLRGYYFISNTYLKTTFMLAPQFSIGLWIKPTAAGLVITKYVSTTQWFVQILPSGWPKLSLLLSDMLTTVSVTGSTNTLNLGWFFVSFDCKINTDGTITMKSWVNGVNLIAATSLVSLFLLDSLSGSMYIGHYDLGFSGFLWSLKIYCQNNNALSDFTTSGCSNGCPRCPANFACLNNCPLSQYWDGSTCTNCRPTCTQGCRNSDTCRLCLTKECATCTNFLGANSCLTCITNAVSDGAGGCTCAPNSFWVYSTETCDICDALCSICLKTTYFECSSCIGSSQIVGNVCLNSCPYGYGASCSQVFSAVIDQSFTTDFQGSYGVFTTGTSSLSYNFFNTPESYDPIPAYKRGLYFDGTMLLTTTNILISHSFSIGAWIYVITNGDWFQKQWLLSLSTTITITANMEDPTQGADTHVLSSSTSFSGWNYLSVTFSYNYGVTNLAIYINGNSAAAIPVTNRVFRDTASRSLWVGRSSSPGFVGFINSFQLWNVPITDFTSKINGLCGSGSACLWSCDLSHYYDGTNYLSCNSCSKGCVRGGTCNICNDLLCDICSGFDSGKCTQCVTNAHGAPNPCVCNVGYDTSLDGFSCILCYNGCIHCTDISSNKCTSCVSGFYYFANTGQCLTECPSGYTANSGTNTCDFVSIIGIKLDLTDQICLNTVSGFSVGADNTNIYPHWSDTKDPVPAYKRGYYFYHNNYMYSTVMIAPSFTISIWTKPLGAGILMTKYISSDILKININPSGYPEFIIKFKDLSSSTLTTSTSILNSWHFLSFSGQVQSDGKTTIFLYINSATSSIASITTASSTYFEDKNLGNLYIGNDETFGNLGLYGFLAQLIIYNSYNRQSDDYAISLCDTCSACPSNHQCLSECDFDKYPDSCSACISCSQGCVNNLSCNLCRDKECYECTSFSQECTNCIANAYKLAGHCKCLDNAVWVSSSKTCEFCNAICATCSTINFDGCLMCAAGNYLIQSLCMTFCPTGFVKNGNICDSDPSYSNFFIFNLMPHQIKNVVADLKSNIPVLAGKDNKFYPNYDITDPIPAIFRGYYFTGSSYMQLPPYSGAVSPLFTFSPKFTISTWIKPIAGTGVIFSKQVGSGLFKKYISLELINKSPSLTLTLQDLSTITYTSTNPSLEATLSQWNFIAAVSSVSSTPQQTISLSTNSVNDSSIDLHASWLNDLENSFLITIGASHIDATTLTSFFNGFLWDLKIYNTIIAISNLVSTTCNSCSLCPIDNANTCLDSCLIDSYLNGNSCSSCALVCSTNGCVRNDKSCNLCKDVICEICDDYMATCITCKTNANLIGTTCQCNSGYYWNSNNEDCELCDISCKTCTSPSSSDCLSCADGYYKSSGLCKLGCPPGYSSTSSGCVLAKAIFDLDLNTLNGVIYDKASSIPVITGSTKQFYPDYEVDDPIPAYLRGFYFNGKSSILRLPEYSNYNSPQLVITSTFTISIWINIENSDSFLLSKYSISNNYSFLYSITLSSNKPSISLIISSSPINYICHKSLNYYEWSHIVFTLDTSNGYNLLSSYLNGISDSSAMEGYGTFNDIGPHTTMTIGAQISSTAVYNFYQGFIYSIQIFNTVKPLSSLSTTSCTESCSACPISQICIPNCRINEYWSGPAYNLCGNCNIKCNNTCKDWRPTCSLCNNLLCDDCIDYSSTGCVTCKENAINTDSCICDINYVVDSNNNNTCIPTPPGGFRDPIGIFYLCPDLCTSCESLTKCTQCVANASLKNDLCYCNLGYNGTKYCISVSFYATLKVLPDNSLYLYFSESLANNLTASYFTITIENQGKISYKIEQINNTCYYISLSISKEILKVTLATLHFLDLNETRSISNGILNSSEISAALNSYDPEPYLPVISTVTSESTTTALAAVSVAAALSVLNPNPSSLWSMINAIQILSYLTLSGIPLSIKIRSFLNNLNSYNLFPNIFQYFIDENEGNTPYAKAVEFGYESDLILITTGNDFTLLLTSISALPIVYFFSRCSYRWIGKKFRKTVKSYQFSFYLRFWIQCYLELGAAAAIGLLTTEFYNVTQLNNFIICSTLSVIQIITPPAFFLFSYKNKNRIQSQEKSFLASFSSLFYEFRTDRGFLATQYYCVFFLRRLIYIINLVYLRDFPQTEVTINIVLSLITILHLAYFWPYKDTILQVSNLLTEILIFLVMSATSVYLFDLEQNIVSIVENCIIAIVLTAIGIQFFASLAIFGRTLHGIIKNKLIKSGIIKAQNYEYKKTNVET